MNRALWHVRAAFAALGIAIALIIVGLLRSAETRLEQQRLYRHEVVAGRVFDEAERDISALLHHEATRPGAAYDAHETDPERWGHFVVGYYTRGPSSLRVVAAEKLGPERVARIEGAVRRARGVLDAGAADDASPAPALALDDEPAPTSSPDVLRQLNRGVKVREQREHAVTSIFQVAEAGPDLLVVERAGETRREGFVLSVTDLVATIQSWVLSAQGLDAVGTLHARGAGDEDTSPLRSEVGYTFVHRLAPPLDGRTISLSLSRLDDDDAGETLYSLAALLVTAAFLGLFAIYRMVAVQLSFAERRDNFVAAVTHELRTPLTSIRMYGEMLSEGMVSDEQTRRDYYSAITSESERLTRLINNVMEHGLLRRGQRKARLERIDAGEVVREVVDLMTPHAAEAGFGVRLEVEPGLAPVVAERDALKQVLFNVLDNALKYGRGERAEVTVSCRAAGAEGVAIVVRDHGPGLDEGLHASIFQPFFRAESELTRRHQGTGLGLSLARDLVELMRGSIQVRSTEPGLEVRIGLPSA